MRKAVVTLTALALLWGMTGTGSAQPFSVGVQLITSPDSVIPTGGTVTHFVGVYISPDETMTVTSMQSALSGDLADASNPILVSTTCSVPSLHHPGEPPLTENQSYSVHNGLIYEFGEPMARFGRAPTFDTFDTWLEETFPEEWDGLCEGQESGAHFIDFDCTQFRAEHLDEWAASLNE